MDDQSRFSRHESRDTVFNHPSTVVLVGPSGSGKTQWLVRLIDERRTLIHPPPERVIYSYTAHQPVFEELARRGVTMVKGQEFQLDGNKRNLLIVDDPGPKFAGLQRLFTVVSHHSNCTVCFVTHNLFERGAEYRTAVLNAKYFVLFKSPRMVSQVTTLARQLYGNLKGGRSKKVVDAYADATARPYGYLVVDLHQETDDRLRYRTNIFKNEGRSLGGSHLVTCYPV
jgi:hypothetical protein